MMNKPNKNTWLFISLAAILLFLFSFLAYLDGSPIPYFGPLPLIIVAGLVILTLGTALAFSAVNLWKYRFHWQGLFTILINTVVLIPIGYAFIIWIVFTVA